MVTNIRNLGAKGDGINFDVQGIALPWRMSTNTDIDALGAYQTMESS